MLPPEFKLEDEGLLTGPGLRFFGLAGCCDLHGTPFVRCCGSGTVPLVLGKGGTFFRGGRLSRAPLVVVVQAFGRMHQLCMRGGERLSTGGDTDSLRCEAGRGQNRQQAPVATGRQSLGNKYCASGWERTE